MTACEAAALIRCGDLASHDYVAACLDAIAANASLFAFLEIFADEALAEARRADASRAAGQSLGPLHGVPFAVKDLINVAGRPTTAQSRAYARNVATRDAEAMRALRAVGAIVLGKLALEECGMGSVRDASAMPPARNPWDPARTAGGSSSGCGAALAAGLVPLALGTDTGGSARNPAAACGVVGLKPTRGRIATAGVMALAPSLDHLGLMARTAADCRLLFRALAPGDTETGCALDRQASRPLRGSRIGVLSQFWDDEAMPSRDLRRALDESVATFAQLGTEITELTQLRPAPLKTCGLTLLRAEAYATHADRLHQVSSLFGARCRAALEAGAAISPEDYAAALAKAARLVPEIDRLFETHDALLTFVVADTAPRFDDDPGLERFGNTAMRLPFNVSGHPALAFCAGFSAEGLPLGLQLIGPRFRDERLLDFVDAYQTVTAWHECHPRGA